jgi:choline dehydrogenase-like flavoprotein
MSHLAFRPKREDVELDADFVVVGSGAGGATAAVTLARGGATVAVVEAGPWRDPQDYPSSLYGTMRDLFDDWGSTFAKGRALWPIVQGSVVGGSTVINSAISVRAPEDVLRRWHEERNIGGPELWRSLERIQDELESELSPEEVPPESRGRANELARVAAERLSMPQSHFMRRYVRSCAGSGQCLQGCRAGRKRSMNLNFVPEVLSLGGIVLSSAPVDHVRMASTRAVGVEGSFRHPVTRARGARFRLHARRGVVVAASATHSPLLLMRSGLRNRALGEQFHAHPGGGILGVYDEPVDMMRGATQGWGSLGYRSSHRIKLEVLSLPPDMLAGRIAGGGHQLMARLRELRHIACWVQATWCETPGRVRPNLLGRPVVEFDPSTADMARFRAGLGILRRMHFAAGARAIIPSIHGLPYSLGPDELHRLDDAPLDPRAYVGVLSHLFGGCVMGRDPTTSVCDGRGRVHGTQSLYVADASMLPTGIGVNPQQTIMAFSRYVAERALEHRSPGSRQVARVRAPLAPSAPQISERNSTPARPAPDGASPGELSS